MKTSAATYRFGEFTLDLANHCVFSKGHEIYLRPKTYETLLYLLQHQGSLVTKNELLDAVWADVEVTENVLSQCVKEARAALGDDAQNARFLKTLPRLGYEFIAEVETLGEAERGEVVEEESRAVRMVTTEEDADASRIEPIAPRKVTDLPTPPARSARSKVRVVAGWLTAAAFVLLLAALVMNFRGLRNRLTERSGSPRIASLAVLPLENLTGDPQQEYFADGMTEELITNLGKLKALRVISRTSVMRYKKTNKPLPAIAKELNVDAVIEGAVLRSGNHVRITAQLIHGSSDKHLWAETYDGDLRDVLALQSEVTRAVAAKISAEVTPPDQAHLAQYSRVDPQAYALYLQGRALWARDSEPENRAAIDRLTRATAIDPNFAPAYAALGRAYVDRVFGWEPKEEWKDKAEAAIQKALSLDPNLAEAHVSRAALLFTPAHNWQHEEAIRECREALALNPNFAEGHLTLGGVYFHVGLLDEALHEFQTAASIEPTLADSSLFMGFTLAFQGKFQEALPFIRSYTAYAAFSKSVEAYDLWLMGNKQEAWAIVRYLLKADPQENFVYLACVHTLLLAGERQGREVERRINHKMLRQAAGMRPYGHFHHVANFIADIYAQMNKPQLAVAWLQQTADTGFPCYPFFEHDRALDPIRQDPRFVAFMQRLKPQWESLQSKYGSQPHRYLH